MPLKLCGSITAEELDGDRALEALIERAKDFRCRSSAETLTQPVTPVEHTRAPRLGRLGHLTRMPNPCAVGAQWGDERAWALSSAAGDAGHRERRRQDVISVEDHE